MQVKVNIYITAAGATRAFLLRDEEGSFPEVIGVGRTLPAAVSDYVDCFLSVRKHMPENERPSFSLPMSSPVTPLNPAVLKHIDSFQ